MTPGSSSNISTPIIILNTIVADSINILISKIKKELKGFDFTSAVINVLSDTVNKCKPIFYEGNNYSEEWIKKAEKRGLKNDNSAPQSLKTFTKKSTLKLFEKYGIFTKAELEACYSIWLDIYIKTLIIEGKILLDIIQTQILPAAYDFQTEIGKNLIC